jgi:hypothetical protein
LIKRHRTILAQFLFGDTFLFVLKKSVVGFKKNIEI